MTEGERRPPADVRCRALGPLRLAVGGRDLAIPAAVPRAVLGALLLAEPDPVPVERLLDVVWSNVASSGSVQVAVSRLRRWLGQHAGGTVAIGHEPAGYRLELSGASTDVGRFRAAVAAAGEADGPTRLALLEEGLALWRGPVLADVPAGRRDEAAAAALDRERVAAVVALAEAALVLGQADQALDRLEPLAVAEPFDEPVQALLLDALAASGRQAEALRRFEQIRARLADELGIDPGEPLQAAHLRILRGTAGPAARAAPCTLPPDVPDLLGRQGLVDQARAVLLAPAEQGQPAVCALSGRAGVGKTAVAVHVAHRLRADFPDGQLHVHLRGTGSRPLAPAGALARLLRALGVDGTAIPHELDERAAFLRARLADRRVLLVLDDAAGEEQVRPLLPATGGVGVLVTSRRRLGAMEGARLLEVEVLEAGQAVTLLAGSAGAERVGRDPDAARAVVAACGRLPLAVRVAGAKLAARPHWPVARLAELLADERGRLDALAAGDLDVRASLSLGYQALPADERRALRRLGLLEADTFAAWVAAPLLETSPERAEHLVEELVDARLLDVAGPDETGRIRYRFHDLVRVFARERALAEEPEADRRAALGRVLGCWLALAEAAEQHLPDTPGRVGGGSARRWSLPAGAVRSLVADGLAWFDAERLALTAAVEQAAELDLDELAWELAASMVTYLPVRQAWDSCPRALEATLAACRRAGNRRGEGCALVVYALSQLNLMRPERGLPLARQALERLREVGDGPNLTWAMFEVADGLAIARDEVEAVAMYEAAIANARANGQPRGEAACLISLAMLALRRGELATTAANVERSLDLRGRPPRPRAGAQARLLLGTVRRRQGRLDEALDLLEEGLDLVRSIGDRTGEAALLIELGNVRAELGAGPDAAAARREARRLLRALGLEHIWPKLETGDG